MYYLYVNPHGPPPAFELDTQAVSDAWVLLAEHATLSAINAAVTALSARPSSAWKRYRVMQHRERSARGRRALEGNLP